MFTAELCILDLLGGDERVAHAARELAFHRRVDRGVLVAEQDGTEAHVVVDVLGAVDVPDVGVLTVVDVDGRYALDVGLRAFAI